MASLVTIAPATLGACATDLRGEVFCGAGQCETAGDGRIHCSRHFLGGAFLTLRGEVLCGRGQCAADAHGRVFCAAEVGGAVTVDSRGRVRCYGGCEAGSVEHCESTVADAAGG